MGQTDETLDGLEAALEQYDNRAVRATVAQLDDIFAAALAADPKAPLEKQAERMLELLRKRRHWELLTSSAELLLRSGLRVPAVWLAYAQALVDSGQPHPALEMLKRVRDRHPKDKKLGVEIRGRIGRVYKDLYLGVSDVGNPRRVKYLQRSIDEYYSIYEKDKTQRWHAINLVALGARAKADGVDVDTRIEPKKLAKKLLADIDAEYRPDKPNLWDMAIGLEAAVALGEVEIAERWAGRYVEAPGADAFELGSTLRQLREVWQLGSEDWERSIVQLLNAKALCSGDGARIDVGAADLESVGDIPGLEKVFGKGGIVTMRWYMNGLERGKSVAKIEDKSGNPIGTGFVVNGPDVGLGEGVAMMTNHHVMAEKLGGVTPGRAVVAFESFDPTVPRREFKVVEKLEFSSPPSEYDTTIFRVEGEIETLDPMPVTDEQPEKGSRIYAIGHPKGGTLSFSIDDNLLLDFDDRRLHYRTPTEPGSSGSPVFNSDWDLIGIHHAGRDDMPRIDGEGTYEANEGIWVSAISQATAG